jgi:hypothetical protein
LQAVENRHPRRSDLNRLSAFPKKIGAAFEDEFLHRPLDEPHHYGALEPANNEANAFFKMPLQSSKSAEK